MSEKTYETKHESRERAILISLVTQDDKRSGQ